MSAEVILRVERKPVLLKLTQTPVNLKISGGRGGSGGRGRDAFIGLNFSFEGIIAGAERLPGVNIIQAATYDSIEGWCSSPALSDAVFKLYNKDADTGITVTFPAGVTTPVLSGPIAVVVGDYIWPLGPTPASPSLSDPTFVLYTS